MNNTVLNFEVIYLIIQDDRYYYVIPNKEGTTESGGKFERFYGVDASSLSGGTYNKPHFIDFYGTFTVEHVNRIIRVRE